MLARPRTMICLWSSRGGVEPNRKTKLSSNIWEEAFSLPRTHRPASGNLHLSGAVHSTRTRAWLEWATHPGPAVVRVSPARSGGWLTWACTWGGPPGRDAPGLWEWAMPGPGMGGTPADKCFSKLGLKRGTMRDNFTQWRTVSKDIWIYVFKEQSLV